MVLFVSLVSGFWFLETKVDCPLCQQTHKRVPVNVKKKKSIQQNYGLSTKLLFTNKKDRFTDFVMKTDRLG